MVRHKHLLSHRDLDLIADRDSPQFKIQRVIELAVIRTGSAAALARALDVSAATVSQWRARQKNPDAIKLIRIQDLAEDPHSRVRSGQ